MVTEERLELDDIQGAVIPGFRKDHAAILAVRIVDSNACKGWIAERADEVARADEVLAFNRLHKLMRSRRGGESLAPKAVWTSLSFSAGGLALLRGADEVGAAFDPAFLSGMFQRDLGDHPPATWVIGGTPAAVPDILLMVAADEPKQLAQQVARLRRTLKAANSGLKLMGAPQKGDTLPGDLAGHEHFGFKDGVSQPAVRGLASDDPLDFIDERRLAPTDASFDLFAAPGRALVWPGQFVLGYQRQDRLSLVTPLPAAAPRLDWQRNGSYLVYRRLQQRVHLFWRFCTDQAKRLSEASGREIKPERFAALLVGRWPSGAPLLGAPEGDDPTLAANADANNDFLFGEDTPSVILADGSVAGGTAGDPTGNVCPFPAHIRKVNPRSDPSDTSGPRNTKTRLFLRRGIPYGDVAAISQPLEDDGVDRGLLFMSYQSSIVSQFEFVTKTWLNRDNAPHDSDPTTGQDPLIGQSVAPRFLRCALDPERIDLAADPWVVTTGGGYFFTPSLSALRGALVE